MKLNRILKTDIIIPIIPPVAANASVIVNAYLVMVF